MNIESSKLDSLSRIPGLNLAIGLVGGGIHVVKLAWHSSIFGIKKIIDVFSKQHFVGPGERTLKNKISRDLSGLKKDFFRTTWIGAFYLHRKNESRKKEVDEVIRTVHDAFTDTRPVSWDEKVEKNNPDITGYGDVD